MKKPRTRGAVRSVARLSCRRFRASPSPNVMLSARNFHPDARLNALDRPLNNRPRRCVWPIEPASHPITVVRTNRPGPCARRHRLCATQIDHDRAGPAVFRPGAQACHVAGAAVSLDLPPADGCDPAVGHHFHVRIGRVWDAPAGPGRERWVRGEDRRPDFGDGDEAVLEISGSSLPASLTPR